MARLKPFDLKVGDFVRAVVDDDNSIGIWKQKRLTYYQVTHVSKHIFCCRTRKGDNTSFTKISYQIGEVQKA